MHVTSKVDKTMTVTTVHVRYLEDVARVAEVHGRVVANDAAGEGGQELLLLLGLLLVLLLEVLVLLRGRPRELRLGMGMVMVKVVVLPLLLHEVHEGVVLPVQQLVLVLLLLLLVVVVEPVLVARRDRRGELDLVVDPAGTVGSKGLFLFRPRRRRPVDHVRTARRWRRQGKWVLVLVVGRLCAVTTYGPLASVTTTTTTTWVTTTDLPRPSFLPTDCPFSRAPSGEAKRASPPPPPPPPTTPLLSQ